MSTLHGLDNLVNSNRTPTFEELREIHGYHAAYEDKLEELDQKIGNLEGQLHSLGDEIDILLESAMPLKCALSPFRWLPIDIIRQIFTACIDSESYPSMSKTEAPTLLTQICSGMRNVALNTPALWAAVHIPPISSVLSDDVAEARSLVQKHIIGLSEWLLKRSGNSSLRISVWHDSTQNTLILDMQKDIIDILISCCSRWSDIRICMGNLELLSVLTALSPSDVPRLKSLYMHINGGSRQESSPDILWLKLGFLSGHCLRRLGPVSCSVRTLSRIPVNWESLTHIAFPPTFDHDIDNLIQVLRKCSHLNSLSMVVPDLAPQAISIIHLPHLRVLRIHEIHAYSRSHTFPGILDAIVAPALDVISYGILHSPVTGIFQSSRLVVLLERTPRLTELAIGHFPPLDILQQCLQYCHCLTTLDINVLPNPFETEEPPDHSKLIEQLCLENPSECLCPQLQYFRCNARINISSAQLHALILRKTGSITHLARWNTLKMEIYCKMGDESFYHKVAAEGVAEGINVELFMNPAPIEKLSGPPFRMSAHSISWSLSPIWPYEALSTYTILSNIFATVS